MQRRPRCLQWAALHYHEPNGQLAAVHRGELLGYHHGSCPPGCQCGRYFDDGGRGNFTGYAGRDAGAVQCRDSQPAGVKPAGQQGGTVYLFADQHYDGSQDRTRCSRCARNRSDQRSQRPAGPVLPFALLGRRGRV